MKPITYVGIADYRIIAEAGELACSALGSCVAVCLWDYETRIAGLLHALLPSPSEALDKSNPAKFVDSGTVLLAEEMEKKGASRDRLMAKLVGGACLYQYERACAASEMGGRNTIAAREALKKLGIPIIAEHVGGEYGRSIRLNAENFEISVNVLAQGRIVI